MLVYFKFIQCQVLTCKKKRVCDRSGGGCSRALPILSLKEGFDQGVRAAEER